MNNAQLGRGVKTSVLLWLFFYLINHWHKVNSWSHYFTTIWFIMQVCRNRGFYLATMKTYGDVFILFFVFYLFSYTIIFLRKSWNYSV